MRILLPEELELYVRPIYDLVFQYFKTQDGTMIFPSKIFDSMRFLYNEQGGLNVKPDSLMEILADISVKMGDSFLYLSFPFTTDKFTQKELPRHFLLTINDVKEFSTGTLEAIAGSLLTQIRPKPEQYFYPEPLIYSPQGLWAVFVSLDHYGWLGTNKNILTQIKSEYSDLDREMERQLFNFIIEGNQLPFDWKYTTGDDRQVCIGWFREMLAYVCRHNFNIDNDIDIDIDVVEAYRSMLGVI